MWSRRTPAVGVPPDHAPVLASSGCAAAGLGPADHGDLPAGGVPASEWPAGRLGTSSGPPAAPPAGRTCSDRAVAQSAVADPARRRQRGARRAEGARAGGRRGPRPPRRPATRDRLRSGRPGARRLRRRPGSPASALSARVAGGRATGPLLRSAPPSSSGRSPRGQAAFAAADRDHSPRGGSRWRRGRAGGDGDRRAGQRPAPPDGWRLARQQLDRDGVPRQRLHAAAPTPRPRSASPAIPSRWCSGPAGPTSSTCAPGRLSRLDDATLSVATAATEPGPAAALQVVTGDRRDLGARPLVGDPAAGQPHHPGARSDARSRSAARPASATVDQSGSIWVPVPAQAGRRPGQPGGGVTRHPFGHPGDAVQVADTSGRRVGGRPRVGHGRRRSRTRPSTAVALPAMPGPAPARRVPRRRAPTWWSWPAPQVLDIDTSLPSLSSLGAAGRGPVHPGGGRVRTGPTCSTPAPTSSRPIDLAPLRVLASDTGAARAPTSWSPRTNWCSSTAAGSAQALVVNRQRLGDRPSPSTARRRATPSRRRRAGAPGAAARRPGCPARRSRPADAGRPATSPDPPTAPPIADLSRRPSPARRSAGHPPTTRPARRRRQPPTVPGAPTVTQVSAGDGVVTVAGRRRLRRRQPGAPLPGDRPRPAGPARASRRRPPAPP